MLYLFKTNTVSFFHTHTLSLDQILYNPKYTNKNKTRQTKITLGTAFIKFSDTIFHQIFLISIFKESLTRSL